MEEGPAPSMIGKDIIRNMKTKYKPRETVIQLRDGENTYDIKTMNIQQLVKRFALRIFHEANIDEKTGKYLSPHLGSTSSSSTTGSSSTRPSTKTTTRASTTRSGK